jgi:hypothetical protein
MRSSDNDEKIKLLNHSKSTDFNFDGNNRDNIKKFEELKKRGIIDVSLE